MKTVVICNSCMQDVAPKNFFEECIIDKNRIMLSLLDAPDIDFNTFFNPHSIIVKINVFSCNFRERCLVHKFVKLCQNFSGNQRYNIDIGGLSSGGFKWSILYHSLGKSLSNTICSYRNNG